MRNGRLVSKRGGSRFGEQGLVHQDRLHEIEVLERTLRAHQFRRGAELVAEGAGEGLMRVVAGVERDREDVGRASGELARRLGQAARAHVAHHGTAGGRAEGPRHVKARHAAALRDIVERDRFRQMTFDEPQRFLGRVHGAPRPRIGAAMVPALCAASLIEIALRAKSKRAATTVRVERLCNRLLRR